MTINGVDVTKFGAKQHAVTIGHSSTSSSSEWIRAALLPHMEANHIGFKQITVDMIVKGASREKIIENRGALLASLLEPATIVLDGFAHTFRCIMQSHKESEVAMRRFHKVSLTLAGYEYGAELTAAGTGSVSLTNPGTITSPVVLKITPTTNASNVTVSGLCRNPLTGEDLPVTLDTITANKVILLDGANGLFTEDGELKKDIDIKCPPGVAPGVSTVTCSEKSAVLNLSLLPLYM